ncbi:MAG: hypothetical protein HYR63_05525 [Proteobacteria bacterium]|nr:hypothetical protein [Pseudomonadota bacterium]MBI3495843.1 hypothetical protein [Pseudomonadota bacterium]
MAKRKTAEERANEIVAELREAIENPEPEDVFERLEGVSGMRLSDWQKLARKEIAAAIREAEVKTSMRELVKTSRLLRIMGRIAFLLMSTALAFAAFWIGIANVGYNFGWIWGGVAALSASGLAVAFMLVGMSYGNDEVADAEAAKVTAEMELKDDEPEDRAPAPLPPVRGRMPRPSLTR